MNESQLTFGEALAYLNAIDGNGKSLYLSSLPASAQDYINNLSRFRDDMNNEKTIIEIFRTIPEYACQSSKPYLSDNFKFFIALLIIKSENYSCGQLTKHLNNCYSCFDVFCHVLRDFFRASNDIIKKVKV